MHSILSICAGACIGAVLRWMLGLALNSVFPAMPLGTLAANLLGGYIIGFAVSVFAVSPAFGARWGLLAVTGFLGSLTTFSSFTYEVASLVQKKQIWAAGGVIAAHVLGSLAMLFLGMATFSLFRRFG